MSKLAREIMTPTPAVCTPNTTLDEVAKLMRQNDCGEIPVIDSAERPVGVITDRDIVVKVMAKDVDAHTLTVADVMTPDPLLAAEDDGISETLHRMRRLGVRRVPVVGPRGHVTGVLSIDDVVDHLVSQLSDVAGSIRNELKLEETLRT